MSVLPKWSLRVGLIGLHVVQYLITASADLTLSSIVAALLLGVQLLPREHFIKTFRARPNLVSQLGSLVWILTAFLEMSAGRGV